MSKAVFSNAVLNHSWNNSNLSECGQVSTKREVRYPCSSTDRQRTRVSVWPMWKGGIWTTKPRVKYGTILLCMWQMPGYADHIGGEVLWPFTLKLHFNKRSKLITRITFICITLFWCIFSLAINLFDENCSLLMLTRRYWI